MKDAASFLLASALAALAPTLLAAGCASVLGVDKTYTLADASAADSSSPDAASGEGSTSSPTPIRCAAGVTCTAPSEECCLVADGGLSCTSQALSDPCPNGTDIPCDDPSDCDGGACCLAVDTSMDVLGTRCASACATGEYALCDPQRAACAQGSCGPLSVQPQPPAFYACQ